MIRTLDISRIRELLSVEGLEIAHALSAKAPVASGALRDSCKSVTVVQGSFVVTQISALDSVKYVISGRRKNAPRPPLESIRTWLLNKGLSPKEAKRAAWPVATAIAERGIPARPILREVLAKRKDLTPLLRNLFGEQVKAIGQDLVASLYQRKEGEK